MCVYILQSELSNLADSPRQRHTMHPSGTLQAHGQDSANAMSTRMGIGLMLLPAVGAHGDMAFVTRVRN